MHTPNNYTGMLEPGHFLGVKFSEGWLFFHVLEREFIELKPWILMNENENRDVIAAETEGVEDDKIQDTQGREYVVPDSKDRNLLYQVRFGVAPSRMQVYPIFGRDRSPNLIQNSEPGEPEVPVTGFDSPYNAPTQQSEFLTFNAQELPALQAYNPMSEAKEARLSFHINKMKWAVVEDVGLMRAMLQGLQPAKLHAAGLGAKRRDQLSPPAWLTDRFGNQMKTTKEILESGDDAQTGGRNVSIPDQLEGVQ